jgi:hypothetical protein
MEPFSKSAPVREPFLEQILGVLGWCRWLAVSRSFFFMEVRKSRYSQEAGLQHAAIDQNRKRSESLNDFL